MSEPKSLQEAIVYFSNPDNCIDYLAIRRWPNGKVTCPTCGSDNVRFSAHRRTWTCSSHHAKREFSIKVGTVMEDSAIGLGQVAYRTVAAHELQERNQQLRDSPAILRSLKRLHGSCCIGFVWLCRMKPSAAS